MRVPESADGRRPLGANGVLFAKSYDLDQTQAHWVSAQVAVSNREPILLSHQLFSGYKKSGDKLKQRLSGPLESGRIRAWFLGPRASLYAI
jgi:hypothetical protein